MPPAHGGRDRDTLIVADAGGQVFGSRIVRTPLDMIKTLQQECIQRVILLGRFARDFSFAAFLREAFPSIAVIIAGGRTNALGAPQLCDA